MLTISYHYYSSTSLDYLECAYESSLFRLQYLQCYENPYYIQDTVSLYIQSNSLSLSCISLFLYRPTYAADIQRTSSYSVEGSEN